MLSYNIIHKNEAESNGGSVLQLKGYAVKLPFNKIYIQFFAEWTKSSENIENREKQMFAKK